MWLPLPPWTGAIAIGVLIDLPFTPASNEVSLTTRIRTGTSGSSGECKHDLAVRQETKASLGIPDYLVFDSQGTNVSPQANFLTLLVSLEAYSTPAGVRTLDLGIKSPLLCQLSYRCIILGLRPFVTIAPQSSQINPVEHTLTVEVDQFECLYMLTHLLAPVQLIFLASPLGREDSNPQLSRGQNPPPLPFGHSPSRTFSDTTCLAGAIWQVPPCDIRCNDIRSHIYCRFRGALVALRRYSSCSRDKGGISPRTSPTPFPAFRQTRTRLDA